MTNQAITRDLRNPCGKGYEKVNNWERSRNAKVDERDGCKKRASIWKILFTPPWRNNDDRLPGAEMPSFVVNTPGGSYTVTDSHYNLAAAAHAAQTSSLAELRQNSPRN